MVGGGGLDVLEVGPVREVLEDELLGDGPGLLEEHELLEDEGLLRLPQHVPPVQRQPATVLKIRQLV